MKSTVEEIRARFDQDVERFSNSETGQTATIDAPVTLDLIARAAAATSPSATHLVDIGCGAGNYSLAVLRHVPNLNVTLVDLSRPMLDRAHTRVSAATRGTVHTVQADIREIDLGAAQCDIIVAAAVFHHLRDDDEWRRVFRKCWTALRTGGGVWISDLVEHTFQHVQALMWSQYATYLEALRGPEYRDHVLAYVEKEDTPRPLVFQLDLLREVGFRDVEILHKRGCFAAFGAVKGL